MYHTTGSFLIFISFFSSLTVLTTTTTTTTVTKPVFSAACNLSLNLVLSAEMKIAFRQSKSTYYIRSKHVTFVTAINIKWIDTACQSSSVSRYLNALLRRVFVLGPVLLLPSEKSPDGHHKETPDTFLCVAYSLRSGCLVLSYLSPVIF